MRDEIILSFWSVYTSRMATIWSGVWCKCHASCGLHGQLQHVFPMALFHVRVPAWLCLITGLPVQRCVFNWWRACLGSMTQHTHSLLLLPLVRCDWFVPETFKIWEWFTWNTQLFPWWLIQLMFNIPDMIIFLLSEYSFLISLAQCGSM